MFHTQTFHQGAPLLKLAQGCGMEPHYAVRFLDVATQQKIRLPDAHHHLPCLLVEDSSNQHAQYKDVYSNRVH